MAKKSAEGLDFLNAARAACEKAGDQMLLPEVLINIGQVKGLTGDHEGGRAALEQALALVRARGDRGRELRVLEHLGVLLSTAGDHAAAADRFKDAAEKALGPEAKEYRKNLRKRMQEEQQRAKGLG
jgi:tetratricopeptide (TPR) repeat protein